MIYAHCLPHFAICQAPDAAKLLLSNAAFAQVIVAMPISIL
jgi:hypothetical protein